jgi:Flp pilus assembly protein protease CpaA
LHYVYQYTINVNHVIMSVAMLLIYICLVDVESVYLSSRNNVLALGVITCIVYLYVMKSNGILRI